MPCWHSVARVKRSVAKFVIVSVHICVPHYGLGVTQRFGLDCLAATSVTCTSLFKLYYFHLSRLFRIYNKFRTNQRNRVRPKMASSVGQSKQYALRIHRGEVTSQNLWPRSDRHFAGIAYGIMCGVKGRRFIVLHTQHSIRWFMKMYVRSLACQQSVFRRYHSEKHFLEFYPQDGGESQLALKLRHCRPMYKFLPITLVHLLYTNYRWSCSYYYYYYYY